MFPFTVKISKQFVSDKSGIQILDLLEDFIRSKKEQDIERGSDYLTFKSGLLGWSWDYFAMVEKGIFIIENNTLLFEFNMFRLFSITTVMSFILYLGTKDIYISVFCFIWLSFGNWLTAFFRYKKMLNMLVREIKEL